MSEKIVNHVQLILDLNVLILVEMELLKLEKSVMIELRITDLMENVLLVVKEQLLYAEMESKNEMKNVIKRMITEKKEVDVLKIVG
ncbi:hypothetical protein IKO18_05930 [bacterium]|nr:hypothetical protein [bacterium]